MTDVVLDTNFLLVPHQHGVDIFSEIARVIGPEHRIVTLSTVVGELTGLQKSKSSDGAAAKVALKLIGERDVPVIEASGDADDSILEYAKANAAIVGTNDRGLRNRLKEEGVKVVFMRGKTHLGVL